MKNLRIEVQNLIEQSEYDKAAQLVAKELGIEMIVKFLKNDYHFEGDKDTRDIYKVTLKRSSRKYSFKFGQSIMKSQYYKDKNTGRTYTLNGGNRTGGYRITNPQYIKDYCLLIKGEEPTMYDILACLTKYDPETFEVFCDNFGYNIDSSRAKKTYKAVVKEWDKMCSLFSDEELEVLNEIA